MFFYGVIAAETLAVVRDDTSGVQDACSIDLALAQLNEGDY